MNQRPPAAANRWRTALLLGLILAAGLALRGWYLGPWPAGSRFYDERFSLDNVEQLLESGELRPRNGYYPLLSYLPQTALLRASDRLGVATFTAGQFTGHAYRLSRGLQALYGTLSLWLVFLLGRRLFSVEVGLVATAALAFSPWHVHASGVFKPDVLLVTTVLLAFLLALRAAERPTPGRWALAGAGVALAMSSKLTGGLAALPLIFISCRPEDDGWPRGRGPRARLWGRRLLLLGLAGLVALALFLLLNPYWRLYLDYLDRLTTEYSWKASKRGIGRWHVPALTAEFLVESIGIVGVLAAAAGGLVLLSRLLRRRLPRGQRLAVATLLFFPAAYAFAYVARTPQFKANNFLPLLPFVTLLAAWALVAAARRLATGRLRRWPQRRLAAAGVAVTLLLFAPRGLSYVYRSLTPTAGDLALRFLSGRLAGSGDCLVARETQRRRWPPWEGARPFRTCTLFEARRLDALDEHVAAYADGVVFAAERLIGGGGDLYLDSVARSGPRRVRQFAPRPFAVRGPAMVAAFHPWELREPPRRLETYLGDTRQYRLEAALPAEVEGGEVVSFRAWLPPAARAEDRPPLRLRMGIDETTLVPVPVGRGVVYISPRLLVRRPGRKVRLNRERASWDGKAARLDLYRWRPEPPTPPPGGRRP